MVLSTTPDSDSNWETTLFDDLPEREIGIATETEVKNLEETEMNAFEMMNKKGKGGKKANVTKKPLKTVTNTASKVKQSLITDHTSGLPKKIRAKASTSNMAAFSGRDENSSNEGEEIQHKSPKKKSHNSSKTYSKKTLNASISSSPVKKTTKWDRKVDFWATLQQSHFSEVDDFDLTFG